MSIDVVRAILGVIFNHENGSVLPKLAEADGFDNAAQGQVVVGHQSEGRQLANLRAGGMVIGQPQDLHLGHGALFFEAL